MNKSYKFAMILIFFVGSALKVEAKNISYNFSIKSDYVKVICTMEGNNSGKTTFQLPLVFSLDKLQPQKLEILINGTVQKNYTCTDKITLHHVPFARISISYEIHNLMSDDNNLYFSSTANDFFFFNLYCLILPCVPENELHEFDFIFSSYKQKIISNISKGDANTFKKNITIKELKNTFFSGGKFIKHVLKPSGSEIIFIGDTLLTFRNQTISFITKIKDIQESFFAGPKNKKDYTIFFTSSSSSDNNLEGSQKDNFKVILLSNKTKFDYHLQRLISHENLHQWFSVTKFGQGPDNQGNNCWFIEGFNDYYTDYLNYLNRLLPLEDYVNIYNNCLENYYTSSFQLGTNKQIGLNQYDSQIFEIAYLRGKILAHELNYKIQTSTNGNYDLDKYIKLLIYLSQVEPNFKFSEIEFIKRLNYFAKYNFTHFLDKNLIKNDLTVEALKILDGKAILTSKKVRKKNFDFDFLKSNLAWQIYGVKKGSKSYIAGLRNGQQIITITDASNIGDEVIFEIKDKQKKTKKNILITPEYLEIIIPQYKILK